VAFTPVCSGSWPPAKVWPLPPAKMPLPGGVFSPLRKLQQTLQSPCMQAFNVTSTECSIGAPDTSQKLCQPNTPCSLAWGNMMGTCTDADMLPIGDGESNVPAKSQLEGVYATYCGPCMMLFQQMSNSTCFENFEDVQGPWAVCDPATRCGVQLAELKNTCTDASITLGNITQQIAQIESLCSPCSQVFRSMPVTCGNWSQVCTHGSACSLKVQYGLEVCAAHDYSYYDEEIKMTRSAYQSLSMVTSHCVQSPCSLAFSSLASICGDLGANPQGHCDQFTSCGGAFNYALTACYAAAGMEMPANVHMPAPPTVSTAPLPPPRVAPPFGTGTMAPLPPVAPPFGTGTMAPFPPVAPPFGTGTMAPFPPVAPPLGTGTMAPLPPVAPPLGTGTIAPLPPVAPPFGTMPPPPTVTMAPLPPPTVAPPFGFPGSSHDYTKCREHKPESWDPDCCGYDNETWCAGGHIKVHSFMGGEHDCWPGRKGYRCYPPSMDVHNAESLTHLKAACTAQRPQPRCGRISAAKAEKLKAAMLNVVMCNP